MVQNKNKGPEHVAIIMDGNGRWAAEKNLTHIEGHEEGAKAARRTIGLLEDFEIKYLTLYAFSTENWKRSKEEVDALMSLLGVFIDDNIEEVDEKGIRIKMIGRIEQIPSSSKKKLLQAIERTKNNKKGTVILALNYGGRSEIVDATKKISKKVLNGEIKISSINEKLFARHLYDPEIPDLDLMIRTSGEFRISNFLLWELCYSEIYISEILWPDFDREELQKAVDSYTNRQRRFGGR